MLPAHAIGYSTSNKVDPHNARTETECGAYNDYTSHHLAKRSDRRLSRPSHHPENHPHNTFYFSLILIPTLFLNLMTAAATVTAVCADGHCLADDAIFNHDFAPFLNDQYPT